MEVGMGLEVEVVVKEGKGAEEKGWGVVVGMEGRGVEKEGKGEGAVRQLEVVTKCMWGSCRRRAGHDQDP
jgi:hypothetical protein